MSVCVPVGMHFWLVVSYESLSFLTRGGAFKGMKAVTLRSLQVTYLSASTIGNIIYDPAVSSSELVIEWCSRCY